MKYAPGGPVVTFAQALATLLSPASPRPEVTGALPTRLICRCGEPWMECGHVAHIVLPGGYDFELTGRRAGGVS